MNKLYLGIDAGSVMIKGVIIDKNDNIITSNYRYMESDPIGATKKLISEMYKAIDFDKYQIVSVGVTGVARKLIGSLLDATVIRNEITAQSASTSKKYPDVKTIIDLGGQSAKIILINNGTVTDYKISKSCLVGNGSFLDMLSKRLNISLSDISAKILTNKQNILLDNKCAIFTEHDFFSKLQMGYELEGLLGGVASLIVNNYLTEVASGKRILSPIVLNGGVSKNEGVVRMLVKALGKTVIIDKNAYLLGALGIAILARESKKEKAFENNVDDCKLESKIKKCTSCIRQCEVLEIY